MDFSQTALFSIFGIMMVLMLWGRWRHDIVAFAGLMAAVLLGLVPSGQAFSGFGNPATMIVALVLIATAGLTRSGAVSWLTRKLTSDSRSVTQHILIFGGAGGLMSGFMNNIAALAMLMPIDLQASRKAGRAAGLTLMPLAFATILGGMLTLIGTPPNLIVSDFRAQVLGEPYRMFDFFPVGAAVAISGIIFIALIGWRLIAVPRSSSGRDMERARRYVARLVVTETSSANGQSIAELRELAQKSEARISGLSRHGHMVEGSLDHEVLAPGDVLFLRADPSALDDFRAAGKLAFPDGRSEPRARKDREGQTLIECLVPVGAPIIGKTTQSFGLVNRYDTILVGMRRRGIALREGLTRQPVAAGDLLLLLVPDSRSADVLAASGVIRLDGASLPVLREGHMVMAVTLFLAAVLATSFGLVTMPIALGCVVIGYVLTGVLQIQELYEHVDWPVIVLLGAMIPLGIALDSTGGTALIAGLLASATSGFPPWVALLCLMAATMLLSDVLNNNATTIVAAPVGIRLAEQMNVQPDAFLMGVAVSAACAFLTPIGHQNNTLILGPGNYRFGDYWRMGLPLEVIVLAVALPMLLVIWPL